MEKIEEKLWEEHQRSSLRFDTRLSTEPIILDNHLARLCLQTAKSNIIEENDNDVYVVWLTNEEKKEDQFLKGINIRIFHSNDTLVDFISDRRTSTVFLLVDYELVSKVLSFLDDFAQVIFIYVLTNEESNDTFVITDSKISFRKISNDKEELSRLIIEDIDTCTKDSICSTIFDLTTTEESTNQTKNTSFIWYYLLIESLFDITVYSNKAKSDFIEYCRQQYPINNSQQDAITQFENDYSSDDAIRWYTRDSFIYRQLNKALRTRDIDIIFKFRFFIIDFQKQLEQHYNEEMNKSLTVVYRGQQISQLEFSKLQNSLGKYVSFNIYLSASVKKEVALMYASETSSILFEIEVSFAIDLKNKRTRPVYVQDKSYFPEEFEVIFPIGSTFHVDSIWMEDERWYIKLKLTDDNDDNQMIDLIQTVYMKNIPAKVKFATLLVSLGDYEKAERYIEILMEDLQLSLDNVNIGYAYDLLGQVWSERSDHQCALSYFEKALNNIHLENVYRAIIYRHIGSLHDNTTEFDIALKYLNQSLKYKEQMDPLELADLYEAFSNVYTSMKNFDDALIYVNQALTIRQSSLSTNNVLGYTYFSLAIIYEAKSDYTEALELSKRAINMLSEIFPKHHPALIVLYAFVGNIYFCCGDLSTAMLYSQKALYLREKDDQKQNLNPTIHIFICNILYYLYNANEDISNALYYAQQAYDIYNRFKNIIPETRSIVRILHSNLGAAYHNICNFTLALNFYLQALSLCEDMNDQITIRRNIEQVYLNQGDTKMAILYFNDSFRLISRINQPIINNDTSFWINFSMSDVYKIEDNLKKSIFYIKEALRLELQRPNKDYENVVHCYTKIMELCPEEKEEQIEEILKIVQKHDLPISSKILCHNVIGYYYSNQNDFPNALHHFELCLNYERTYIPPYYKNLIDTYSCIGFIYSKMEGEYSDTALSYFEKSRDIYLELLNMKEIPVKDKKKMVLSEGYLLKNIKQHSLLTGRIFLIYHSIAIYYVKKGDYEKALNHLQTINQILSEYNGEKILIQDNKYFLIGFAYESMQHYDEAIFFYEKSLAYISNDYNKYGFTFFLIGKVYYKKKEYLTAISKCKISLTFLYNSKIIDYKMLVDSYSYAAWSYENINNYEYALIYSKQQFEHALLCTPIDYTLIESVASHCEILIRIMRPWNSTESSKYILTVLQISEYDLDDSQLKNIYFSLSSLSYLDKQYDNTLLYYSKILEYDTKNLDDVIFIYQQQWLIYMFMGQFDTAYDTVKKTINKQFSSKTINFTDVSNSYMNMGFTYHRCGKYKLALKSYRSAFYILEIYQKDRQHKNYARIYNNIGHIYLEYGQVTDARNYCLKVQTKPSIDQEHRILTSTSYIILGLIECKLENYYTALDYLGQAWEYIFNEDFRFHMFYGIIYNHIGYVYFKLGQREVAMKNYLKSISLYRDYPKHPDLAQVYKNIGLIYEGENDYPTALSYYKRALELVPNKEHPHYILYKSMIITLELKLKNSKFL